MPNPSTPLPRVGEVWGEPSDPGTWRWVVRADKRFVDFRVFREAHLIAEEATDWQSWSRDKQLIQPTGEAT